MLSENDLESARAALGPAFRAAGGESVSAVLADFGWADLLATDPAPAVATVFELLGRTGATAGALGGVMGQAFVSSPWSPATVLLPLPGHRSAPPATFDGAAVSIDALCVEAPSGGEAVVAAHGSDGGLRLALVAVDCLDRSSAGGTDPWLGLVRLRGAAKPIDVDAGPDAAARWQAAVSWGRLALAAQLAGLVQASLDLAADHARIRSQFGRQSGRSRPSSTASPTCTSPWKPPGRRSAPPWSRAGSRRAPAPTGQSARRAAPPTTSPPWSPSRWPVGLPR